MIAIHGRDLQVKLPDQQVVEDGLKLLKYR